MVDADGGTSGSDGTNKSGVTPPDINTLGGRFKATTKFIPSRYGQGSWDIEVVDTVLGGKESATVWEARNLDSTAKQLAQYLLDGNAAGLAGRREFRFDVPNQEEKAEGPLDNDVENSLEQGDGHTND